jgi:uncharacterized protein
MTRMKLLAIATFLLTLSIGGVGGWVMWHFHMPLAWLLGAMIFCGLAALAGLPPRHAKVCAPSDDRYDRGNVGDVVLAGRL